MTLQFGKFEYDGSNTGLRPYPHGVPMRKLAALCALVCLLGALTGPALAQLFGNRQNTQAQMQNAQAQMQIDQLQEQVRILTGQVEQLGFQVRGLQDQLRRFQEDSEFRFQQLEAGDRQGSLDGGFNASPSLPGVSEDPLRELLSRDTGELDLTLDEIGGLKANPGAQINDPQSTDGTLPSPPSGTISPSGPVDLRALANGGVDPATGRPVLLPQSAQIPADEPVETFEREASFEAGPIEGDEMLVVSREELDPTVLFDKAYRAVVRGDYAEAEVTFILFIDSFPNHRLAPKARYWLGESYFSRGQYQEAANIFLNVYQDDPTSRRAPASLLKLAQALDRLGETAVACATLRDVISKYPEDEAGAVSSAKRELTRAQC